MLMKIFGGVGCVTSNKRLDIDGVPGNDPVQGILNRNYTTAR